jgi:glutamate N-acetyltransferase / amino-acid N-acetyltransferase
MRSRRAPARGVLPRGFRFAATACGLKKNNRLDLALISSDLPAAAAGVFTTNLVQAAPVVLSRAHVRRSAGAARAIVVNSGNANCATGPAGTVAARATAARVARELGCKAEQVLVCSTGVIGVPLRVERILRAVPGLARAVAAVPGAFRQLTRAIMTTDTRPKWAAANCRIGGKRVRLLGCAKGAGMIHPQMATMLAFVLTDASAQPRTLQRALREVVGRTFNAITIDGDTSTNDTLLLLANGASGAPRVARKGRGYPRFVVALEKVCRALALAIVADGEGAKRVVEIEVRGAPSDRAAEQVARTIAGSPLVKTALAGADPNWGRILAAAGRAPLSKKDAFDPARVEVRLAGMTVCRRGREHPFNERAAHRRLLRLYVPIVVDLKRGPGRACIWTCDFTADYVRINASYRT